MTRFGFVFKRGLVAAALCLTAGVAQSGRGEEPAQGISKVTDFKRRPSHS